MTDIGDNTATTPSDLSLGGLDLASAAKSNKAEVMGTEGKGGARKGKEKEGRDGTGREKGQVKAGGMGREGQGGEKDYEDKRRGAGRTDEGCGPSFSS